METKIIFYKQQGLDQNTKFKLRRELLGLEQKSNFSRYKYDVKGILDEIPYYRPVDSAIIVKKEDVKKIENILTKYGAALEVFEIKVPKTKLKK